MSDWKVVAAQLKAFDGRREVVKAMRKGIRKPVPAIRKSIKARAKSTLPARGGLGKWVASTRVGAKIKIGSRRVDMTLKGGRNSEGGRSDISAIDRGRVRAPTYGRRTRGAWHSQTVPAGFFREPAAEGGDQVLEAIDREIDQALEQLRRG